MVRVAVIGCGAIAQRAYLPVLTSIEGAEVVAVVDVNESLARDVAKRYGIAKYYTDHKKILQDDSIDLACVCTPSYLLAKVSLDLLRSGKHVLVEKPLALSVKDGKEVLEVAKEEKRKVAVAYEYRYFPSMKRLKETIESGRLGTITTILGVAHIHIPLAWTKSTWLYQDDVGVLYDFAPHLIDAILWLISSNVEEVVAFGQRFPASMTCLTEAEIMLKFKSGATALASVSWLTGTTLFTLSIYGTGGRAFEDVFYDYLIEVHGTGSPLNELKGSLGKLLKNVRRALSGTLFEGGLAFYRPLILDVIQSIEKGGKVPISGEDALNVLKICDAAKMSIVQKRSINIKEVIEDKNNVVF